MEIKEAAKGRRKATRRFVAFQGEPGAFSHAAARKLLGDKVQVLPCTSFQMVFDRLSRSACTYAVIPIENTLHGSVLENYDHLLESEIPIVAETNIRISHQLIARPGVKFRDLRRVLSHPVALNQCRHFFEQNQQLEAVPYYDTAGSVKMLEQENPAVTAAIASAVAAELYEGVILKRNIEDDRRNFTRFFLLTKQLFRTKVPDKGWKTSVAFATANVPGALFRAMACFALRDLNLTKIESRPIRGKPWQYLFYVDLIGSKDDVNVRSALTNLAEIADFMKVLGTYRPIP